MDSRINLAVIKLGRIKETALYLIISESKNYLLMLKLNKFSMTGVFASSWNTCEYVVEDRMTY